MREEKETTMTKDNRNNKRYNDEIKEAMVAKLLPPSNMSLAALSAESGIPPSTLNGWKVKALKEANNSGLGCMNFNKATMTLRDKFRIVMETYTFSEYELGKFCRTNGLFVDELKKWRLDIETSIDKEPGAVKEIKEELYEEKRKNKILEKELNRKEKALAEAAALLVLQKKFQAFMEEEEY
jgi:transposase-like protein